jgi:CheY-like chemotaxis protein
MKINYYCFNLQCGYSIFDHQTCVITKITLEEAIKATPHCKFCNEALVAKPMLKIERQLTDIVQHTKTFKSIIIDEDLNFQLLFRQLFQSSACLNESIHLNNGTEALAYLHTIKDDLDSIPDFIFADMKMSSMGIWDFLEAYEQIAPQLARKITIYLISDVIVPISDDRFNRYPSIKALIHKNFNVDFLNRIC